MSQMHNFLLILNIAMHRDECAKKIPLEEPVDWAYLSQLARSQNLLPIFVDIAQQYENYRMYPGFPKDSQDAMAMVAGQIQRSVEFLDLYKAFLHQRLSPVVFKGITLRQIYGPYGDLRISGDEDILIRPKEYESVRKVLEDKGFQCAQPDLTSRQLARIHHVKFYKAEIQFTVEVHINIFGTANHIHAHMNQAVHPFVDTEILEIEGVPLHVMNPCQSYLCLIFHTYKHFLGRGIGIRHIMDILKYADAHKDKICFTEIGEILKTVRADTFLRDIQWIGNQYFDFPTDENSQICCPQKLLDDLFETGIFGGSEKTDRYAAGINLTIGTLDTKNWRLRGLITSAFPGRTKLIEGYPYLEDKPWLLPAVWVLRFGKFGKYAGKDIVSAVQEILNKAKKRVNILRKYWQ